MKTVKVLIQQAERFLGAHFPEASFAYLAGSLIRGDGNEYSDLDIVVLFDSLPHAYRESFLFENRPIEAFVHDPETLKYFFEEIDVKSGRPSLPTMVVEASEIALKKQPDPKIKALAKALLDQGPAALSLADIAKRRYFITDLIEDLRSPKNHEEFFGTATRLYENLADFWLRSNGHWSSQGKWISRSLKRADLAFSARFQQAFDQALQTNDPSSIVLLAEEVLKPHGGVHFAGYRMDAPAEWRSKLN